MDVNLVDKKKGILFIIVCFRNYLSVVKRLIEVSVDVNLIYGGKMFFMVLFDEGYMIVVFELIMVGVSVNKNF